MDITQRVSAITPSSTLMITAKANELRAAGIDVIGLGAGEPDFNTPEHIIEAAYLSMKQGLTKYTPSGGVAGLKDAIIAKLRRDQQLDYLRSEILVGVGAKQVLAMIFQALLNEGDEVVIPAPYWVSYPEQVKLAGGTPVIAQTTMVDQYKITPELLQEAVTSRTKAVIINSPNNPTGMVYSEAELLAIGKVCLQHQIIIISDEIYEKLIYGSTKFVSIAQLSDELKALTIVVNGLSKSHAMTGWRIGYAAGNQQLIGAMETIASHTTSNPNTNAQYGAIAAYNSSQESVLQMQQAFSERRKTAYQQLSELSFCTCEKPAGAFYFWVDCTALLEKCGYDDADQFANELLAEKYVAVVPGSGFGAPNHIRISYATGLDALTEGITRISGFIKEKVAAIR